MSVRAVGVYPEGVHLAYLQDVNADYQVNTVFSAKRWTREEGISWNWNARPADGEIVRSSTRARDQVGAPISNENGSAVFVGGPASVGQELVWSAREERWIVNYRPTLSVDYISDGEHIFTMNTSDDWYTKQIAFDGIPWSNFAPRPGTSADAQNKGAFNDEVNVIVYDATGDFGQAVGIPGGKGTIIDTYLLASKLRGAKTIEGSNNFYQDLINNSNQYIYSNAQLQAEMNLKPGNYGSCTSRNSNWNRCKSGLHHTSLWFCQVH